MLFLQALQLFHRIIDRYDFIDVWVFPFSGSDCSTPGTFEVSSPVTFKAGEQFLFTLRQIETDGVTAGKRRPGARPALTAKSQGVFNAAFPVAAKATVDML